VLIQCLYILSWNPDFTHDHALNNALLAIESRSFYDVVTYIQTIVGVVGMLGIAAVLAHRYRTAAPASKRVLGPVYLAGLVTMALLSISLTADVTSWPDGAAEDVIDVLAMAALAAVPVAFVGALLRVRLVAGGGVSQLVRNVGTASDLRALIADALGDSSVQLAFWLPERGHYVDAEGRDVTLPEPGSGRSATVIDHDGRRVAAIVHDPTLDDARDLVQGAGAAIALALDNQRLNAELRARVEELRASRTRIVEAGIAERRRLERDLHDGAQQRLVALRLALRLARDRTAKDPDGAAELLDSASSELDEALAELRELARGIHPAVLTDRGLGPALEALATRAPLPVTVEASASDLPPAIESATYFLVAEALTNVAKYAEATSAHVTVARENGAALVEISDDGIGGADPAAGTGLAGLVDRIAALDGTLEVDSPAGEGTTIRAAIPVN
jgi:signal transduction histidine kinase